MKRAPYPRSSAAEATGAAACTPSLIHNSRHWPALQHVAVPLAVRIPLPALRLREVQELQLGALLLSTWPATEEVPLLAAGVALSWCEFEGAEQTMAVRVTRLG